MTTAVVGNLDILSADLITLSAFRDGTLNKLGEPYNDVSSLNLSGDNLVLFEKVVADMTDAKVFSHDIPGFKCWLNKQYFEKNALVPDEVTGEMVKSKTVKGLTWAEGQAWEKLRYETIRDFKFDEANGLKHSDQLQANMDEVKRRNSEIWFRRKIRFAPVVQGAPAAAKADALKDLPF